VATRSARLAAGRLVGRPAGQIYVCPADRVVIVKAALVSNLVATSQKVQLYVTTSDASVAVGIEIKDVPPNGPAAFTTWTVLEPGDGLNLSWESGSIAYWVSGALLPLLPT